MNRPDPAIGDVDWLRLPAGGVRSDFAAPSGELAVVSFGDPANPRVVLVPGVTGSKEDFVLVMPALAAAGYFVQSFDLAGQYQSADAGPATGPCSYELFAGDLIAFIEAGAAPVHLVGYSFAGVLSQLVCVARPELVATLTLLGCPPQSGRALRGIPILGPLARLVGPRVAARAFIAALLLNLNRVPRDRLALVRHRFGYTRPSSVGDVFALLERTPDLTGAVRASGVPVLVAAGARDVWPAKLQRDFARRLDAHLALYDTGHSPCETTPQQLTRDLLAHFHRADSAAERR